MPSSRLARWTLSRAQRPDKPHESQSQPEHSLTSLPNELLLVIFDFMDDTSLHLILAVSKRLYQLATESLLSKYGLSLTLGLVAITTSDALRALRVALTLYRGTLHIQIMIYFVPAPSSITKDIRRLDALLRRFWSGSARIPEVRLIFRKDIIERPVGWKIGGLTPRLLATICGHSHVALVIVDNGLFTCTPKSLLVWSPYIRDKYSKMTMHDGSRQWVPSIRSIRSLDITHPICASISADRPWTMIVVSAAHIRTLLLSIRLSALVWSAILPAIKLPNLREVGIWADTISSEISTAFLARHPIAILKYMSPYAEPLHPTVLPLALPELRYLTALSHYIVHILSGRDSTALFPQLVHVEVFPDARFHEALHLLSLHITIGSVDFWSLVDFDPAAWPVFPNVDCISLNKCDVGAARLPALIAHSFPALRRLGIHHSFPKINRSASQVQNNAIWKKKQELVRKIAATNPGVDRYYIDKEFFPPP
ncbi:hypothetical protein B0H19DRAFT_1167089 [Mycena capillaripes]|nr:hypothetical protein B0H19DRAFT_1167089 [Mycena capillaripes]